MTLKELREKVLQLPLEDRWQLVQQVLVSIQQETLGTSFILEDEQAYPHIKNHVGTSGQAKATIKGTGIRVQTIVIANTEWDWDINKIAEEYNLSTAQVSEALRFYKANKTAIDRAIASEEALETVANA